MAKLIAFDGINDEMVWINPGTVAMVEEEAGHVVVFFAGADVPSVFLKGAADAVAAKLNKNMGWWWS